MSIRGADAHRARLRRLSGPGAVRTITGALKVGGDLIEAEAAISMTRGRSEVIDKKNHVPSKPGEAPAVLYGDLRRSLETVVVAPLKVEVSANDPKANLLENGTSKMAARPFMGPATHKNRPEVVRIVTAALRRVIERSGGGA